MAKTIQDRFWAKVNKDGPIPDHAPELGPCWVWTAAIKAQGYGGFRVGDKIVRAHRFVYELMVGPIPDGLVLDHVCRNHACVRPSHLEPVTNRINLLRGQTLAAANVAKTVCSWGHPFSGENLIMEGRKRRCRDCRRRYESARPPRNQKKVTING